LDLGHWNDVFICVCARTHGLVLKYLLGPTGAYYPLELLILFKPMQGLNNGTEGTFLRNSPKKSVATAVRGLNWNIFLKQPTISAMSQSDMAMGHGHYFREFVGLWGQQGISYSPRGMWGLGNSAGFIPTYISPSFPAPCRHVASPSRNHGFRLFFWARTARLP
jgi:hypothetical protein